MASSAAPPFVRGQVYKRRIHIHGEFGGKQQGGIAPSRSSPFVFLFTGDGGEQFGYKDEWKDGVFLYSGEGQIGDQVMKAGNKAVKNHTEDGRDLLLFTNVKTGVQYEGVFHYAGYETVRRPGKDGNMRNLIVFHLLPDDLPSAHEGLSVAPIGEDIAGTIEELRALAYSASSPPQGNTAAKKSLRNHFERSEVIRRYVLARSKGICECCGTPAPFKRRNGEAYLESHHIHKVSEHGRDDPRHVAAICPTCHRRIHFGEDGATFDNRLLEVVRSKETATES